MHIWSAAARRRCLPSGLARTCCNRVHRSTAEATLAFPGWVAATIAFSSRALRLACSALVISRGVSRALRFARSAGIGRALGPRLVEPGRSVVEESLFDMPPGNTIAIRIGNSARQSVSVATFENTMKLILASASPRRAEILRNAGIPFEVHDTQLDETQRHGELYDDYVRRLAREKARAAADAKNRCGDCLFIGADTIVLAGREILGKPVSEEDARRMLRKLSGSVHEVHTGLAVVKRPERKEAVVAEVTRVTFAPLTDHDIDGYIATGEPFDKAGAYGIQGIGGRYVTRIDGCYFNVMGLPLARLWLLLKEFGWKDASPH